MKEIKVRIETVNDTFYDSVYDETARILEELARRIKTHQAIPPFLWDSNGNRVGEIELEE